MKDSIQDKNNTDCMYYAILVPTLLAMAMGMSGCTVDNVRFAPYPAIAREMGRADNGRVEQIKASADKETAYWQTQKQQDGLQLGGN